MTAVLQVGRWLALALLATGVAAQEASFDFDISAAPQHPAAQSFSGVSGVHHSLQDYRGQFVLLNVRATWRPGSVRQMGTRLSFSSQALC